MKQPTQPMMRQLPKRIRFDQYPSKRPITLVKMPWDDQPKELSNEPAPVRKA
jgi:hypothetical protein